MTTTNWVYSAVPVTDFILESPNIDCNPEWQRPDISEMLNSTSAKPSKAQSIIWSMLTGIDIGEIKLCLYKGRKASIDGGNRKRAIIGFYSNNFPLHKSSLFGAAYFRDLPKDVQKNFRDYTLRFIQYGELNDEEIGRMFRNTNNTTHVNHQEMMNSFGQNKVAVLVRRIVRKITEVNNDTHRLFDFTYNRNTGEKQYTYLAFNNNRLLLEEQVARILCRIVDGERPGLSTDKMIEDMYVEYGEIFDKDEDVYLKIQKKLDQALTFFYNVADESRRHRGGRGLAQYHFSMLGRLYFYMTNRYGQFKVDNYEKFWEQFSIALDKFTGDKPSRKELIQEPSGNERLCYEAFSKYLKTDIDNKWKYDQTIEWFLQEFDPLDSSVIPLDPKRVFTQKEIESALIRQEWKDYVDGKSLTLKDAVGAHVVAWSKGGKTQIKNLVVTSKEHNRAMGTMNVEAYKSALGF